MFDERGERGPTERPAVGAAWPTDGAHFRRRPGFVRTCAARCCAGGRTGADRHRRLRPGRAARLIRGAARRPAIGVISGAAAAPESGGRRQPFRPATGGNLVSLKSGAGSANYQWWRRGGACVATSDGRRAGRPPVSGGGACGGHTGHRPTWTAGRRPGGPPQSRPAAEGHTDRDQVQTTGVICGETAGFATPLCRSTSINRAKAA